MSPPRTEYKLQDFALWIERTPRVIVGLLTLLYIGLILSPMQKILWHDELFTFYIAQSPSLDKFFDTVHQIDWQPPLIFATAWLSQHFFGVNEFATRLPSVLAFFAASIGLLYILKRHIGIIWASLPILLFWFSFYFKYATEARPYALLIAFFVLSLFSYERAIDPQFAKHRTLYVCGLLIGNIGMMLSHILAPFSIMPFGLAELVRTLQRRKIDVLLWLAIVAPLGIALQSRSKVKGFEENYFPVVFQASFKKMAVFFAKAIVYVWPLVLLGGITAFLIPRFLREPRIARLPAKFPLPQLLFGLGLLIPPILINLVLMRSSGAFWERYCITTVLLLYVLCGLGMAAAAKFGKASALVVFFVVLVTGLIKTGVEYRPLSRLHAIETIRPDLPMVDASGLAFLEMDHYERPPFLKRLYYLTDRRSAIHYSHATLFENFGEMPKYFPIRATTLPYSDFIKRQKHFMVFGTPEAPEDWLFKKLEADGAQIGKPQPITTPYRDYAVYEVLLSK